MNGRPFAFGTQRFDFGADFWLFSFRHRVSFMIGFSVLQVTKNKGNNQALLARLAVVGGRALLGCAAARLFIGRRTTT